MRFLGVLLGLVLPLFAEPPNLRRVSAWLAPGLLRGGGADPTASGRFFTWGAGAQLWQNGRSRPIAAAVNEFDGGGCVTDADADGNVDLILSRRSPSGGLGELVWLRGPGFIPTVIDRGVEMHDCLPATLFGRSGFLTLHRETQVRFYRFEGKAFAVQEVYSIYTDSRQAGLAVVDVDADGRPDIIAGNYWVRSPGEFHLSWHIFAIHLHHQTREAARFTYAAWPDLLVGAQRSSASSPVRIFRRPSDPHRLWTEELLPGVELGRPQAATRFGVWAVIGHAAGLLVLNPLTLGHRNFPGPPPVALWVASGDLYAVSSGMVSVWRK